MSEMTTTDDTMTGELTAADVPPRGFVDFTQYLFPETPQMLPMMGPTTLRLSAPTREQLQIGERFDQYVIGAMRYGSPFDRDTYCSAYRSQMFQRDQERHHQFMVRPPRTEPVPAPPQPWAQVAAEEGSVAFILNHVAAETQVMLSRYPESRARVVLPNGWEVSLCFGPRSHASTARWRDYADFDHYGDPFNSVNWAKAAISAEVALVTPEGELFDAHDETTWGFVDADDLPKVIDAVAQIGQREGCPCPSCTLAPVLT